MGTGLRDTEEVAQGALGGKGEREIKEDTVLPTGRGSYVGCHFPGCSLLQS